MDTPVSLPSTKVEAICEFFGLGDAKTARSEQVGRGAMGMVWRLDAAGASYAVKELFWEVDPAAIRREVDFCLAAAAAKVRAPHPLAGAGGEYLCSIRHNGDLQRARLYTWAAGVPIDPFAPSAAANIGALLGRLHALRRSPTSPPDDWYEVTFSPEVFATLTDEGLSRGLPWARTLRARLPLIERLVPLVSRAPRDELIESHLDLAPSNVLVDQDGPVLLDWDDVGPAHPDRELAWVLLRWCAPDNAVDERATVTMLESYRAHGGHGWVRSREAFAMSAATWLNFIETQVRLTLDPARAEHAAFSEAAIRQSLARPPAPATMDRIIDIAQDL